MLDKGFSGVRPVRTSRGAPDSPRTSTRETKGARASDRDRRSVDGRGSPWSGEPSTCGALPWPWRREGSSTRGVPGGPGRSGHWTLDFGYWKGGTRFCVLFQGPRSKVQRPGSWYLAPALCMLHAARCLLLILSTPTWSSGPVRLARSRGERRRGLIPTPGPFGLLLRCRSVHTFGMRSAMSAVAFDRGGVVLRAQVLSPRRVLWVRRAEWIAEIGFEALPEPGERAVVTPILATWPAP